MFAIFRFCLNLYAVPVLFIIVCAMLIRQCFQPFFIDPEKVIKNEYAFRANSGSAMKSAKNALPVSIHCCSASIFGRSLYITYCSALYCVTQVPISRLCSGIMDKMTFAKPFGDMLKEKRKLRGLSQMGLAMKSGRSLRCIQYLEAGTHEPTLSTLYAIAHALDLRVMDLIEALPEELNDMYN